MIVKSTEISTKILNENVPKKYHVSIDRYIRDNAPCKRAHIDLDLDHTTEKEAHELIQKLYKQENYDRPWGDTECVAAKEQVNNLVRWLNHSGLNVIVTYLQPKDDRRGYVRVDLAPMDVLVQCDYIHVNRLLDFLKLKQTYMARPSGHDKFDLIIGECVALCHICNQPVPECIMKH